VVVVGDLVGSGESTERGVVGETPNLAARLQGIARPGAVLIADATRRLIGELFELEDLGAQELKGVAAPVQAYGVIRARSIESRFEALHPEGLTALIGREEEVEILMRRWGRAKACEGQVALICGEPGIGKSRLAVALEERLQFEPHARLRYFSSQQHADSALHPIISQLERAGEFAREDDLKTKLDKLDAELARRETPAEDGGLFAALLGLGNDGRYPEIALTAPERRRRTFEAFVAQIDGLSQRIPTLLTFEDAQWADPSSLEALDHLADRIERLSAFLLVTYRPEFAPAWVGRPHVTAITLNRLTRSEIAAMVENVAHDRTLPEAVKTEIVERSGGVPLFAEEMTKAALEAAEGCAAPACTLAVSTTAMPALPASLQASLLARLDRLGAAKDIVQAGAAIGREFSRRLLARVAKRSQEELDAALDRLVKAGLLVQRGAGPEAAFAFKHALCQDVAYGALLREQRRALHARIVEAMESRSPDAASVGSEVLARHYAEAGLMEKAAIEWAKAGRESLARSALAEAEPQLRRALDLVSDLTPTAALRKLRKDLKLDLARVRDATQGPGRDLPIE
jgi:predicted ATPase